MMSSKARAGAGAAALVLSAFGELAQFAVAPAHISGGSAADQVAAIADQGGRMRAALWLDLLILLLVPAILYLGKLADARRSKLAATGTVIGFVGALGAGYLFAADALVYLASRSGDRAAATDLLSAYEGLGVVVVVTVLGVLGTTVGLVLLGIALVRARSVPVWVGVAIAAAPILSIAGEATEITAVAIAAYALQLTAFAVCAYTLLQPDRRESLAPAVMTRAGA